MKGPRTRDKGRRGGREIRGKRPPTCVERCCRCSGAGVCRACRGSRVSDSGDCVGLCVGGVVPKSTHLVTVHDGRRPGAENPKASQHTEHLPPGRALPRHKNAKAGRRWKFMDFGNRIFSSATSRNPRVPAPPLMPVIYCLIARGKLPLAEYSRASGNFTKIAHQLLNKIPSYNTKMTYDHRAVCGWGERRRTEENSEHSVCFLEGSAAPQPRTHARTRPYTPPHTMRAPHPPQHNT